MEANRENAVEFISGQKMATVSFTNQKHVNRIRKLYGTNADDFEYFIENADGSVCARIPLSWIRVSPPRQVSDEQKQAASERFKQMWADKGL